MSLGVLLLTDSPVFAGTEKHMIELAGWLESAGVDVTLACPAASALANRARAQRLEVFPLEKRLMLDPSAVARLRQWLEAKETHIIHAHNGRTALNAAFAAGLARRGAVVATQHFIDPHRTARRGLLGWLSQQAHASVSRRMAHWIAVSEAVRNAMIARGDAPLDKIRLIPNGIAMPRLNGNEAPEMVRAEIGVGPDTPLIVCVARLEAEKDIATLIGAMGELKTSYPNVRCAIAGEGTLRSALEEQITRSALGDVVKLLGFRDDAAALIRAADIFVLPSRAEPFGLVLLEAMALGKPVIAMRAGGPIEIVEHGVTGLLVDSQTPSALADALARLLVNPGARAEMGRQGLCRFQEKFTVNVMGQATLAVYREALLLSLSQKTRRHV